MWLISTLTGALTYASLYQTLSRFSVNFTASAVETSLQLNPRIPRKLKWGTVLKELQKQIRRGDPSTSRLRQTLPTNCLIRKTSLVLLQAKSQHIRIEALNVQTFRNQDHIHINHIGIHWLSLNMGSLRLSIPSVHEHCNRARFGPHLISRYKMKFRYEEAPKASSWIERQAR